MTGRENLVMVARLYGQGRNEAAASAERILEQMDLVDAADRPVQDVLGRHAPAARPRGQPRRAAAAAAARRADDGARPGQPQRGVGRHPRDELGRDRHPADDAVPRRGRPPGGAHRHHRRRAGSSPRARRTSSSRGSAPTWSSCTRSTSRRMQRAAGGARRPSAWREPATDPATRRCSIAAPGGAQLLPSSSGRSTSGGAGGGHLAAAAHPRRGVPRARPGAPRPPPNDDTDSTTNADRSEGGRSMTMDITLDPPRQAPRPPGAVANRGRRISPPPARWRRGRSRSSSARRR